MRPLTSEEMKSIPPGKMMPVKGKVWDESQKKYVQKMERATWIPKTKQDVRNAINSNAPVARVERVGDGSGITVSRGNDLGTPWPVAGRKPTSVGKQTSMALSSVYGFFSRVRHLLSFHGGRLWIMAMDTVHSLFGRG